MKKLKLKEVSEIYGGYAFKSKDFGVGENLVVKIKDIKPPIIDVENADKVDVSKYSTQKLEKFKVFPDDIVIAMTGATIGKVGRNKSGRTVFLNQRVAKINPNFKEDLDFIYYCINNTVFLEYVLNNVDSKSAQANISHFGIGNFEINWYDRETRQKIAKVLTCLDDKIFINSQINQELEVMAKTLYDYWFVQFDFPDQNGKPYKSSGGKMVYNSELKREIPEGWGVEKLEKIANITMGQSPKGTSYNEVGEGMLFFQGSTDFGWRFPVARQYTTEPSRIAEEDDILLSVRAPVGTLNIADTRCCIGRGLAAINSKVGANSYIFNVMQDFKKLFDMINSVGTTFGSITKDDLYSLQLVYPPTELLMEFDQLVKSFDREIKNRSRQNQELNQLRDWLLPMLMNGQVKVE
ncbi:EcoKI restriction-modification system protein HsdS [Streptococcus mitis]|uniref:restriction endonuclease subunit S n=1 Tax=Streptococcus mitis TaxID=28037 RepID=UPI000F65BA83|nr:EcoKI restriction-modification system protein HsdS [Streptococcus mitis]